MSHVWLKEPFKTIQHHLTLSHSPFCQGLLIYGVQLHSSLNWPTFMYRPLCGFLLCNVIPIRLHQAHNVCCLAYMSSHGICIYIEVTQHQCKARRREKVSERGMISLRFICVHACV